MPTVCLTIMVGCLLIHVCLRFLMVEFCFDPFGCVFRQMSVETMLGLMMVPYYLLTGMDDCFVKLVDEFSLFTNHNIVFGRFGLFNSSLGQIVFAVLEIIKTLDMLFMAKNILKLIIFRANMLMCPLMLVMVGCLLVWSFFSCWCFCVQMLMYFEFLRHFLSGYEVS